ncbi:uncharacterized protein LOC142775771 [Rhipicephalus microplus]|uniref:uncharacterized protein LOC142775771 n=1 Tax=Rhipicephalus microplus TaxID=6941 RepID=UPI003F6AC372
MKVALKPEHTPNTTVSLSLQGTAHISARLNASSLNAAQVSGECVITESKLTGQNSRKALEVPRWSKFPEPSTTASLIIIWWFWDVKPHISIKALEVEDHSNILAHKA